MLRWNGLVPCPGRLEPLPWVQLIRECPAHCTHGSAALTSWCGGPGLVVLWTRVDGMVGQALRHGGPGFVVLWARLCGSVGQFINVLGVLDVLDCSFWASGRQAACAQGFSLTCLTVVAAVVCLHVGWRRGKVKGAMGVKQAQRKHGVQHNT